MKFVCFLAVCYVALISSTSAAKHSATQPVPADTEEADDINLDQANKLIREMNGDSDESDKLESKEKAELITQHGNTTEPSVKEKTIHANVTKLSNVTEEDVETSTPYHVKHYLTVEQKYYMLRINLLGIGIKVVHSIIPIPVANADQYKESMEVLLDKVQAAREAYANTAAGKTMHNITLEDAHKLQIKMAGAAIKTTSPKVTKKSTGHSTEVMVVVGVLVAIVLIGVMIFVCKRGMDSKSDSPYYDHLQGGVGGSVPLN